MCLFVYCPDNKILVDYYLKEQFHISTTKTRSTIDLIIKNLSDNPINRISILCSHNYLKSIKQEQGVDAEYKNFFDYTYTIKNENHFANLIYKSCGNSLNVDNDIVCLSLLDHDNPELKITKTARISDGLLLPKKLANSTCNIVLKDLDYTLFEYIIRDKEKYIAPQESIFIRFGSKSKKHLPTRSFLNLNRFRQLRSKVSNFFKNFIYFRILDSLRVPCTISGPHDTLKQFRYYLKVYELHSPTKKLSMAANELREQISNEINSSNVFFKKMLLHVAPRKFRLLHSFFVYGDLKPIGESPTYYMSDPLPRPKVNRFIPFSYNWKRRVYVWIADLENKTKDYEERGDLKAPLPSFHLNYSLYPVNIPLRLITFAVALFFIYDWLLRGYNSVEYFYSDQSSIDSVIDIFFKTAQHPFFIVLGVLGAIFFLFQIGRFIKSQFF